jgi:hypothetical protein
VSVELKCLALSAEHQLRVFLELTAKENVRNQAGIKMQNVQGSDDGV